MEVCRYPFTTRLKNCHGGVLQPIRLKIDPGSQGSGIALVRESGETHYVIGLFELSHRDFQICEALQQRAGFRRRRRSKNLLNRQPRFNNRTRPKGWLASSLQHRVDAVMSWATRLRKLAPITENNQELVRFDMQQMQNPEISGIEY
ncbi:RRXRR domain-containing protein [Modicisalibacter luteus]|uniref:RRXRR domain-containing protein n=1 Tax=Modicisalibacter luteus TaxID=453962 RepID=A0ABV7M1E2_9GAMM|nr:RRXRR domain-containing protein [Halomonas lutea]GHB15414.1 hypothetical protein GCM10007159_42130 [Halomonas lutea]